MEGFLRISAFPPEVLSVIVAYLPWEDILILMYASDRFLLGRLRQKATVPHLTFTHVRKIYGDSLQVPLYPRPPARFITFVEGTNNDRTAMRTPANPMPARTERFPFRFLTSFTVVVDEPFKMDLELLPSSITSLDLQLSPNDLVSIIRRHLNLPHEAQSPPKPSEPSELPAKPLNEVFPHLKLLSLQMGSATTEWVRYHENMIPIAALLAVLPPTIEGFATNIYQGKTIAPALPQFPPSLTAFVLNSYLSSMQPLIGAFCLDDVVHTSFFRLLTRLEVPEMRFTEHSSLLSAMTSLEWLGVGYLSPDALASLPQTVTRLSTCRPIAPPSKSAHDVVELKYPPRLVTLGLYYQRDAPQTLPLTLTALAFCDPSTSFDLRLSVSNYYYLGLCETPDQKKYREDYEIAPYRVPQPPLCPPFSPCPNLVTLDFGASTLEDTILTLIPPSVTYLKAASVRCTGAIVATPPPLVLDAAALLASSRQYVTSLPFTVSLRGSPEYMTASLLKLPEGVQEILVNSSMNMAALPRSLTILPPEYRVTDDNVQYLPPNLTEVKTSEVELDPYESGPLLPKTLTRALRISWKRQYAWTSMLDDTLTTLRLPEDLIDMWSPNIPNLQNVKVLISGTTYGRINSLPSSLRSLSVRGAMNWSDMKPASFPPLTEMEIHGCLEVGSKYEQIYPPSLQKLCLSGKAGSNLLHFSPANFSLPNLLELKVLDCSMMHTTFGPFEKMFPALVSLSLEGSPYIHDTTLSKVIPKTLTTARLDTTYLTNDAWKSLPASLAKLQLPADAPVSGQALISMLQQSLQHAQS